MVVRCEMLDVTCQMMTGEEGIERSFPVRVDRLSNEEEEWCTGHHACSLRRAPFTTFRGKI